MLTGFNTDVQHGTLVLHVQTEDKGSSNPLIESLVYLGGRILDRERSDYRELLDNGKGLGAVTQLMERQHREVIERIRGGHLDERLVAMGVLDPAAAEPAADPDPTPVDPRPAVQPAIQTGAQPEPEPPSPAPPPAEITPRAVAAPVEQAPMAVEPEPAASADGPFEPAEPAESAEAAQQAEGGEAAEEIEEPAHDEKKSSRVLDANVVPAQTLDQVILDYLNAEADEERLVLVMDTNGDLRPGREAVLRFQTRTSLADEPVAAADVRVRVITTSTEPLGLGRGETDTAGRLELRVKIPDLAGGAAALIVNARSRVGDAELKHLI
jgi:hypothetical protein